MLRASGEAVARAVVSALAGRGADHDEAEALAEGPDDVRRVRAELLLARLEAAAEAEAARRDDGR